MTTVINNTNQVLTLSDGRVLVAFGQREINKITDLEKDYQSRNWITLQTAEGKAEGKSEAKSEGEKKK